MIARKARASRISSASSPKPEIEKGGMRRNAQQRSDKRAAKSTHQLPLHLDPNRDRISRCTIEPDHAVVLDQLCGKQATTHARRWSANSCAGIGRRITRRARRVRPPNHHVRCRDLSVHTRSSRLQSLHDHCLSLRESRRHRRIRNSRLQSLHDHYLNLWTSRRHPPTRNSRLQNPHDHCLNPK